MKTKLLFYLLLAVTFSSCVIREPEVKPDVVSPGMRMFDYSDFNLQYLTRYFNRVLLMDSFFNSPDSLKKSFRDTYFYQFQISHKDTNHWYLKSSNDTAFVIVTDSQSIQKVNAEWLIKDQYDSSYCKVSCIAHNSWVIKAAGNKMQYWNVNAELQIVCKDTKTPLSFFDNNFTVTGKGVLNSSDDYGFAQKMKLTYQIKDPLIHESKRWTFVDGNIDITAQDSTANRTELASAKYINGITISVEIIYHGKTKVYDNWQSDWYLW